MLSPPLPQSSRYRESLAYCAFYYWRVRCMKQVREVKVGGSGGGLAFRYGDRNSWRARGCRSPVAHCCCLPATIGMGTACIGSHLTGGGCRA